MAANDANRTWALDREIVLARVLDAPRALVFKMWTDPEHVMNWLCRAGPRLNLSSGRPA